jgi:hypothetical protein
LTETSSVRKTTSPFSIGFENLPIIIVIIGAANRKIFKK